MFVFGHADSNCSWSLADVTLHFPLGKCSCLKLVSRGLWWTAPERLHWHGQIDHNRWRQCVAEPREKSSFRIQKAQKDEASWIEAKWLGLGIPSFHPCFDGTWLFAPKLIKLDDVFLGFDFAGVGFREVFFASEDFLELLQKGNIRPLSPHNPHPNCHIQKCPVFLGFNHHQATIKHFEFTFEILHGNQAWSVWTVAETWWNLTA